MDCELLKIRGGGGMLEAPTHNYNCYCVRAENDHLASANCTRNYFKILR